MLTLYTKNCRDDEINSGVEGRNVGTIPRYRKISVRDPNKSDLRSIFLDFWKLPKFSRAKPDPNAKKSHFSILFRSGPRN